MRRFRIHSIVAAVLIWGSTAHYVQASPINTRPHVPGGGLSDLQAVFDSLHVSGPGIDAETGQLPYAWFDNTASGGAVATFVIELASFSDSNAFGIYSVLDPSKKAEIFSGATAQGSQALISFLSDGTIKVNGVTVATGFADYFGFYIDVYGDDSVLDATYYSDDALNPGGSAHALIYQGDDETVIEIPGYDEGRFTDDEFIVAFEDGLPPGNDSNVFTDLVVLVESIEHVPAPGAAVLALIGSGMIGWIRRRNG